MIERTAPMCKKNVAAFLAIAVLTVLLLLAIGYYLFHSSGRGRILAPSSSGAGLSWTA